MTANLQRLSEALAEGTLEQMLEKRVLEKKEEIEAAISSGEDYVLDTELGLVISRG